MKNIIEPEKDLFQQSLHQEKDFYRGIANYKYKSAVSFFLGSLMTLLVLLCGLLTTSIFIAGVIAPFRQHDFSFIMVVGPIVLGFFAFLVDAIAFKLCQGLISTFQTKKEKFRTKVILLLIIPIIVFIIISLRIISTTFSMDFGG